MARAAALAIVLGLAPGLVLVGCGETFQRGYVLPDGALEQIPLGSSQEQVLLVLGTPSTVATVSGEAFYYISQKADRPIAFMPTKITDQRVIAIYFDRERKVQRLAEYGYKDGKIFDFVSRTTPTSGADLNVIPRSCATSSRARALKALAGAALVREHGEQEQRHDVGDLDHRVDGGAGRILVGIADGVAGHRGLVGVGALAAVMAVLDVFLGVVPGAAA